MVILVNGHHNCKLSPTPFSIANLTGWEVFFEIEKHHLNSPQIWHSSKPLGAHTHTSLMHPMRSGPRYQFSIEYRKAFGPIGWIHCNPETICAWNTVATNTQRCCKLKLSSIAWFVTNHIGLDLHFESLEFRQPPLFKTISSFLTPFLVRLPFGILFWSFDPCNYIIFCKNIEKSKFDLEVMMTSTSGSLKKLKTRHLMVSTNKPLQIAPLLNLKSAF